MSKPSENKPDDMWIFILIAVLCYWGNAIENKLDEVLSQNKPKETVNAQSPARTTSQEGAANYRTN